jgi:sugar lactone lactonase YvrE
MMKNKKYEVRSLQGCQNARHVRGVFTAIALTCFLQATARDFKTSANLFAMKDSTVIETKQQQDSKLIPVCEANTIWNGVTTTADGRIFVCFPHLDGDAGMRIGEVQKDGIIKPYPDAGWNSWKPDSPANGKFMRTNSLRIGPDGNLWVVDTGTPKNGASPVKGAAKLVIIDVKNDKVIRTILLDEVIREKSFIDDIRIGNNSIYITDAGEPALIILNLKTGRGRRVLENQPSTTDNRSMLAEGRVMIEKPDKEVRIHADQLELSPDGSLLYYQPASGPMSKIETKYLNDSTLSGDELAKHVQPFFDTPTTGGTAIDAAGNLYVSDVDHSQIIKISPGGKSSLLLKDSRFTWVDALWIDDQGYLWMPAGQLNRAPAFQNGVSKVVFPVHIYKYKLDIHPVKS